MGNLWKSRAKVVDNFLAIFREQGIVDNFSTIVVDNSGALSTGLWKCG